MGRTFQPASTEEQAQLALPVLKAAWVLISRGWCRGFTCDAKGMPLVRWDQAPAAYSLVAALKGTGCDDLHVEYARRLLKRTLHEYDLAAWNDNPLRKKREVLDLLVRVIGGNQPKRRGGFYITPCHGGER